MIGHDALRENLEQQLPQVILLLGPEGVGKKTLARHLARHHGYPVVPCAGLSAAMAREIVNYADVKAQRAFIVPLDGATETAQNILLKAIEEPPERVRYLLVATRWPLPTIVSRAEVHKVGLLSDQEIAAVLVQNCGVEQSEAKRVAPFGRGALPGAMRAASENESSRVRSIVSAALRAAAEGGGIALEVAMRSWGPEHTEVLRRWAGEASSGRWVFFTQDFAPRVTKDQARTIIRTLSGYPDARNAAAVALGSAFS